MVERKSVRERRERSFIIWGKNRNLIIEYETLREKLFTLKGEKENKDKIRDKIF